MEKIDTVENKGNGLSKKGFLEDLEQNRGQARSEYEKD